jgi:hypothetical protein
MDSTEPVIYMTEYETKYQGYRAVVLEPGSTIPNSEMSQCYETTDEVIQEMRERYGKRQTQQVPSEAFEEVLQQRTTHSPEMLAFLQADVMGDLRRYHVYGSHRPPLAAWTSIPDAVALPVPGWQGPGSGYATYVATPVALEEAVQAHYGLTFLSRPAPEKPGSGGEGVPATCI